MRRRFLINKHKVFIIIIFFIILEVLSMLPYFNIVLNLWISIVVTIVLGITLLSNSSSFFFLAICLMLITVIASLFYNNDFAEQTGNAVYFILLIGFIKSFIGYLRSIKNKK